MTKPLTSVAVMMLYEEGRFQLDDPITRFLPEFSDLRVLTGGNRVKFESEPARRPITIRDLLTHTSGLTYGFMEATLVDALYRQNGVDFGEAQGESLAEVVARLARQPLLAQPGAEWNYSVATDVLGHLVAVVSGVDFADFLRTPRDPAARHGGYRLLRPRRQAAAVRRQLQPVPGPHPEALRRRGGQPLRHSAGLSLGGGGLVSTAADYMRFCRFLLGRGALDGTRLLGRKTVDLMLMNHLDGDLAAMGQPRFSETAYTGIGFGLGFSVMLDPARAQIVGTPGEVAWGGLASTAFWVDPAEDLAVVLLTQLIPSSALPLRRELRVLTYAALVD